MKDKIKLIVAQQYTLNDSEDFIHMASTEGEQYDEDFYAKYNPFAYVCPMLTPKGNQHLFISTQKQTVYVLFESESVESYAIPYIAYVNKSNNENIQLQQFIGSSVHIDCGNWETRRKVWEAKELVDIIGNAIVSKHFDDWFNDLWLNAPQSDQYTSALMTTLEPILSNLNGRMNDFFTYDRERNTLFSKPFHTIEYCDNWFRTNNTIDKEIRELYLFYRRGQAGMFLS